MMGTRLFVVVACAAVGCGSDAPSTEIECASGTSGVLAAGGTVTVASGGADLNGAAITAEPKTTVPGAEVSIQCAPADIVPAGYVALGPPVSFGTEGTFSDRPFLLTLPYKAA